MRSRLNPALLAATVLLTLGLLGSSALAAGQSPASIVAAPSPSPALVSAPTPTLAAVRAAIAPASLAPAPTLAPAITAPTPTSAPTVAPTPAVKVTVTPKVTAKAAPSPAAKPKADKKPVKKTPHYAGKNHFWFPALGISRPVYQYGCRGGDPPNRVYIWGCRSANNTYVFGHAYGVFHPLQMGYHNGRLKLGNLVYYAGADRKVHTYKVVKIRHVRVADYDEWSAWATGPLSRPGMTLQTCDGAKSQYRILVRLVMVK